MTGESPEREDGIGIARSGRASDAYLRRALLAIVLWTAVLGISLGAILADNRAQVRRVSALVERLEHVDSTPDLPDLRPYLALVDDEIHHSMMTHGLAWLLGTGAALGIGWRMSRQAEAAGRAEHRRAEAAAEFRATMEACTVGVYRLKGLRFDYVNPAMAAMLGYEVGQLIGRTPMDIVLPEDRPSLRERALQRIAGIPGSPFEIRCRRRDGTVFEALTASNRVLYHGDARIVGSLVDISQRARTEAKLRDTVEALGRSNGELERFAYVASHDLQEPLRSITSFAQLLERRLGPCLEGEDKEYLDFIIKGAKRMRDLVTDLLTYSRLTQRSDPAAPASLAEAVAAVVSQNLRDSIVSASAELRIGPLPAVLCDRTQLVQLLQNLLGNALKFRRPGFPPVIRLSARRDGAQVEVMVEDNGIGIAPEHREQIFTVFRRLHNTRDYPGTGVGLAICKRIVEGHGGRLWVEDGAEGGACFHFTLPAAEEVEAEASL